jgi:hypothetical protein
VSLSTCPCPVPEAALKNSLTPPTTISAAAVPATTFAATVPATTSAATVSATTFAATISATTFAATVPATTFAATIPATTSAATVPATTSAATVPATTSAATVPATTSVATVPATTSASTVPATTSAATIHATVIVPEPLADQAVNVAILILHSKEYQIFIHSVVVVCVGTLSLLYYLKKRELAIVNKKHSDFLSSFNSNNISTNTRVQCNDVFRLNPVPVTTGTSTQANIVSSTLTDTRIEMFNETDLDSSNTEMNLKDDYHSVESLEM